LEEWILEYLHFISDGSLFEILYQTIMV